MEGKGFRTSLAGRSIFALVLFIGYYVLAIAMAGLLVLIPYVGLKFGVRGSFWVLAFYFSCVAASGLILWSVVPRPERFKAPGPKLTPASDPRLFEEIFRLARELGQKAPREAYLMPDVTAWVSERGGFMGVGSRRIVAVGLLLLEALSIGEFRAVLAHEFGHYRRGDTRLGPLIYRTRSTIGRTLQHLPFLSHFGKTAAALGSALQHPFVLYGNWFLRITQAISRRQEYLADELSATTAGRDTAVSALRKTFIAEMGFQMYWNNLLALALNAGVLPPYADGFREYTGFEPHQVLAEKALSWHIENVWSEPHDSHPSLGERIKALDALPAGREPEAASAISLLEDLSGREKQLFTFMNPEDGPKLKPVGWDDVTAAALIPYWAGLAKAHSADLAGVTPKDLPSRMPELAEWGRRMGRTSGQPLPDDLPEDQAKAYATGMVAVTIVTKMIERGWQASAGPGQYTVLRLGERSWEPFRITNAFADGERTVEEWLELCSELGIADLDLGPAEPAEAQEPSPGPSPSSGPSPSPPEIGADMSAPKSARKRMWKLVSLVGVGLVVVVLIEITDRLRMSDSVFDNSDRSAIRDRTPSSSRSDGQPPFSLSIRGPDLVATVTDWSSGSRSYGATVDVLNRGPKAYNFIMVRVEFCDAAGRVVGTLLTDARSNDSILPGSVRTFKVSGNGSLHFATARASVVYSAEME
jgi:heat shock protein HtpX